ncbi:MAG: hypothetical protein GWO80_00815 [Bacteroidetes bacterium]|nr:hypothetical protein [Bacteroidota bacterium]
MRTVLLTLAIATMAIPALTNNGGAPAGKSGSPKATTRLATPATVTADQQSAHKASL